jgi:hypothetical protein
MGMLRGRERLSPNQVDSDQTKTNNGCKRAPHINHNFSSHNPRSYLAWKCELDTDSNSHCPQAKEGFVHTIYLLHLEYGPPTKSDVVPETVLLGILTTCDIQGHDAALDPTYFKTMMSYIKVVDLAAICAVIGCIQTGTTDPQWAIVDQSGSFAPSLQTTC